MKDLIRNFRSIKKKDALHFNDMHLGNGNREAPPTHMRMPDLDPKNNESHKKIFYERAKSQIIYHRVLVFFGQDSINKLMTQKKTLTWFDSNSESVLDDEMIVYLISAEHNPETKVCMQVLRNAISSTKSSLHDNNISDMLENVTSVMTRIRDLWETHDNLMKDTFESLLTATNTEFHQHFALQKLIWQGDTKTLTFE